MKTSELDVSIVSVAHDVADARLYRHCAALRRAGLSVEVIGLGDPVGAPAGVRVTTLAAGASKGARAWRAVTVPWQARGRVLMTLDPDLAPATVLVRMVRRCRFVADVHEDYAALLQDRSWSRGPAGTAARAVMRVALAAIRRADLTVVADDHVPPDRARRRMVVRNLPGREYLPTPSEPDLTPRAIYIGDVRRSRGLQAMIAAIEAAPAWTLDIVGPVAAQDAAWLAGWQDTSPASSRVRVHGRLTPQRAWALARGAWVGLALLADTPAFREAIPTKLYEYLGSGLPVLVSPLPRMARIVDRCGAGAVIADPVHAAAVLHGYLADPASFAAARAAARHWSVTNLDGSCPGDGLAAALAELAE
jgi:glycosyltransferase involved in cell wall biosynthesis